MRKKVTFVGAGNTGGAMALLMASRGYADVVMIDVIEGWARGKALDIAEAAPWLRFSSSIAGTEDWRETAGSDVVVVTAGVPRKPGMTREDLLGTNASIMREVVEQAVKHSPETVVIVFANPMDAMCHVAFEAGGLPAERVVGQGGMLDSARFRTFIAMEAGVSVADVSGWVLGGHTEATMVPIVSGAAVGGVPITQLLDASRIEAIVERTKRGGAEIVELLRTTSAFVAPAVSAVEMVDAVLRDERRILPCCALLSGQWGITEAYVGVPVLLGAGGIQAIYEPELSDDEVTGIQRAADAVRDLVAATPK